MLKWRVVNFDFLRPSKSAMSNSIYTFATIVDMVIRHIFKEMDKRAIEYHTFFLNWSNDMWKVPKMYAPNLENMPFKCGE